ncbi:S-layer domain protein [Megasphaera sp. BL7]|uniref:ESPR-type extended signal peptide-containing protein n=1 Tax=unclassified Megasphaera TaxID=2626256 RepID=UPI000357B87E|nr:MULTISPECIES: ESPR-type extended signal peptide-containing protein [unclassified Megasphaera]EPP16846.1 S-layer domain protein [Megasphaera sp. BL7]EPP18390.1 S-layer domain protein [Megasphaera sp. NM10]
MNKIFKVIWSKSRNCYVVASELAKGHTKASSTGDKTRRPALAAITALILLPVGGFSYAADATIMVEPVGTGSTTAVEVYTKEGIDKGQESLQKDIQKFSKEVQNELLSIGENIQATDGAYVDAFKSVGENLNALDTQVKANADAINEEALKRKYSVTNLEKADAAEAAAREAADTALDTRITNVKEYLEKQTSDNYVSKDDAAVQDGAIVRAANTIGENVALLDKGLADETAARLGADAAQDKVIQQVNQNMVDGFNALSQADANELAGRVAADTKLVEAVNSGLSLSDDNVLQKNTTTIDAQGNVTTSKTDAHEMILNKGKDNQITLNEKGIKVGTNSTVVDKDGVYTGGDTYSEAKAAMSADGSIKGANGAFTVDENGNVTSKATITGETVTDGKGASMSNGTVTGKTLTDGIATIANGNINTSGSITGGTVTSTGNISALGDIHAGGAITGASASIQGALTAGSATITGDLTAGGAIQGKSISDSTATMQNGNLTGVKNLSTETITTSGDATIGGDLTVNGKLNVDEIDLTKNGIVGDNNVTASTKVAAGEITSYQKTTSTKDGSEKESAIDYDENGTSTWAKSTDADGNWKKSTLTVEGSDVTSKVVDSDKNSNESKQTSTESSDVVKDADGNTSTFSQRVKDILQEIKNASGDTLTKVEQTDTAITSQIGDGSAVKSEMTADGITNTAVGGTITNSAKDLVNTATGNMTNTVGGELKTTVTGKVTEDYKSDLDTKVGGNQTTTVTGDSSLTAENITNEAKNKITNKAIDVETDASSSIVSKVSNEYGSNTSTQLSYQTKEEMSQVDGKTASYLRGAAEEKSQLTDGDKKTTIDTIAGQTNTNITDGTNTSNSLQKADQVAFSVTDGTNTTVVNQDAMSLASSITDGTKANNTNSTVDKSEQLIKASDTQYSATTKTATKTEDALVNGSTLIDIVKDSTTGMVSSAVTDGSTSTGISQSAKDISLSAAGGTIANAAQNITNTASESITNTVGKTTVTTTDSGTTFENTDHNTAIKEGTVTKTTISGNTIETGQATMDYADVMKDLGVHGNATVDQKLTVKGDSDLQGNANVSKNLTVNGTSDLKGDVTMESNATVEKDLTVEGTTKTEKLVVNNGATVTGGTTADTLHVTSTSTFDGQATFKDIVTMEKDLSVGGNATVAGSMTASSYKVGDKTYIDSNGINANDQKVVNVAPGRIAADSTDAVNGSQLYQTNERVTGVENKVNKLDSRVDKVGANAAALANLHPLEFDADSKWNIAAAVGGYKGETATAIGAFYRPNENVMVNVSSSFGTGENMYGGGISLRIGQGGNKARRNATNGLTEREKAQQKQIDYLTSRLDALLSVINPNMSKDFPDVPENHWAYEAVSKLAGNGIIQGYEDGKYHGERTMTRYEMAEIIYNALSKGAKAEKKLVEEFKPELQAMAAQKKA